jgi:predicted dinucleotide-binding enzyme
VGRALAKASVKAGHRVTISSTTRGEAARVASEVGAGAAESNRDAVAGSQLMILAVPYDAVSGLIRELGPSLDGKTIVDVTNRFTAEQLDGTSNAEAIRAMAGGAKVVKAFNTVFASHQADPEIDTIQLDGFVAADDGAAKQSVLQLVESLGFRAIDAGPLAMSRALEAMATLNIHLNVTNGWPWQSGWKLLGPSAMPSGSSSWATQETVSSPRSRSRLPPCSLLLESSALQRANPITSLHSGQTQRPRPVQPRLAHALDDIGQIVVVHVALAPEPLEVRTRPELLVHGDLELRGQ